MSQGPKLELRQGQSLVMTQQLQQSIKLLQCNALELKAFVEQELEKNPFLLEEDTEKTDKEKEDAASADTAESAEQESVAEVGEYESWDSDAEQIERDYTGSDTPIGGGGSSFSEDTRTIDDNPSENQTLQEHLLEQMQVDITDPVQRIIAIQLIDLVDEAGYFKGDLNAIAETSGLDEKEVKEVLLLLQTFDPIGVCARDLEECLALQLKEQERFDPAMECLLQNLSLMAEARFDKLQKLCGVDGDDLKDMIGEIRALNPKPGGDFVKEVSQTIEPDMFIRRAQDGQWHVEVNMGNFPKVMVNQRYYKEVSKETKNNEDKKYFSEQYGTANWLIKTLEQRAETLLKVTSELVKQQDGFFRLGVRYMKPMTLKDIASETGYHESTISRVTNGKFLICPRGTFELKYFFTSALSRSMGGGDDVSSKAVKDYIAEMIEKETVEHILSDDEIADRLKDRNIEVARRTVAKYREALSIPSSPKRRRLKKQAI